MRYLFCISILLSTTFQSFCQIDQSIGEWRSFLPYNEGQWVTQSDEKIYYSTKQALLSINKADVTDAMFMSKVEGLTDVGIRRIQYDNFNDQLIIVYDNSNIDIISDGEVINLSNIKNNQILTGDRSINDIHLPNKESVFFATAFGIVEFNLQKLEFTSTIFTNVIVNDITSNGDILYAATDNGIYYVNIADNVNIIDFSSWELLDSGNGLFDSYEAYHVEVFNNKLYANVLNELWYQQTNGQFEQIVLEGFEDFEIRFLAPGRDRLLIGALLNNFGRTLILEADNSFNSGLTGCSNHITYAVEDEQGRLWYADEFSEIRWSDSAGAGCHKDRFNSPNNETASDIEVQNGKVYVASGGVQDNYSPQSNRDGFYIYDNGLWTIYNSKNIEELVGKVFLNNFQIEPHPEDDRVYVASYYEGLLEYNPTDGKATIFNSPPITATIGDSQRERISGLAFDENGTLWINNYGAVTPLLAYTAEGNWHAFNPAGDNQLAKVVVDKNGYTWSVLTTSSGGVVVHSDGGTIADPSDDESRFINSANSEIVTGTVNTVAVDLDGEVWVGTDQGPVIFDSGPSIFTNENRGSRRLVTQDSIPAILLETEDIRAIEFDGANRKWFGTRNGIFVQSPDGKALVMQFNEDNSPLFDNTINAFEYDGSTGVMYIATNKGMQSYRTETLGATSTHSSDVDVYAFPNPVRPDYRGDIAIKGLARDAIVKITDLNGKLVHETIALGGQAIWDGRDYTGRRAATGVYYVFSTGAATLDTPDSFVTKIMIVN